MENRSAIKGKTMLATLLVAAFGAFVALFIYTRVTNGSGNGSARSTEDSVQTVPALFTSLPVQEGLVDFTYAAEQTVHAVVHVKTKSTVTYQGRTTNPLYEFFYGQTNQPPRVVSGYGSGVIISADGFIITNNHVIEDADNIEVTLNNNKTFPAEIIGRDPTTDIALLKIKEADLPFVKYGNSDDLKLGEWVLAVGNPFNLTSSVTAGIVSAKGRNLGLLEDQVQGIESFIQTDAALNMGNSGGALVNTKGELVGITSAIISPTMSYSGNSFAIPVNIVKKIVNDLREFGEVQRAIIGVNIEEVTSVLVAEKNLKLENVSGVYLAGIIAGGAADAAGLKENDVIIKIDATNVSSVAELQEQVSKHRPGDKVSITFIRDGKERAVPVVLKNLAGNTDVVLAGSTNNGTVFGSKVESLTEQDKRTNNLDYGVKVTEVGDGRLKDIGILRGSIIKKINGRQVSSAAEIRDATSNEKTLYSIEGIQSNGTEFNFQFRN